MRLYSTIPALLLAITILTAMPSIKGSDHEGSENLSGTIGEVLSMDIEPGPLSMEVELIDGIRWSIPHLENCIYPPANGGPSVPVISYPLQVPYEIRDIKVVRGNPTTIPLSFPIAPSVKGVHLTEEVFSNEKTTGLDLDWSMYIRGTSYPEEPVMWSHIGYGWETGERLAHYSISVSPFDHDPVRQTLTFYSDIELVIERSAGPENNINYMTRAVERPGDVLEGTELMVISHDPFINDLEDYIQWKKETGLIVTVMKYSDVNSEYPSLDGTKSIWQFLHDTYFGDGKALKWVLLMGETKYVPTLMAWDQDPYGGEPDKLPADTYYACLDGTYDVWNGDGDDRWAETRDIQDFIPDVYVSRVSVDNDKETADWAKKVVRYEKNPEIGDWTSTVGLFGSTTHSYDDGPTQCEYYWSDYLKYVYETPDKYYSPGNTQTGTGAKVLNYNNIWNGFNSGLSTVVYMGHGLANLWSEGTQEDSTLIFTTNEASDLTQSPRLPFISAMSCETNWYDNGNWESISEEFIENDKGGAIGYVGASRTTEGGIGYTGELPGAPGIQQALLLQMKNGYRSQGEIFHRAKESYVDEWGAYFTQQQWFYNAWLEHNLLGSPETMIWTEDISTFTVTVDYINDHYSNFTVMVKDGSGIPVKEAIVAVYSESLDRSSKVETDGSGKAVVPFEISGPAYGYVTVTKENFKPFQNEYYLTDDTPPVTTIDFDWPYPDGERGWYKNDPGIGFSCNEPGTIRYEWNGGQEFEFSGDVLIPKGESTLGYWTEDLSGNIEVKKSTVVKFDPDTPKLAYTVTPESPDGTDGWYSTLPIIETSASGDEASPQRVDFWWGRGTKEVSNGTIHAIQGENELHLQALDDAGNRDTEITLEFKVDSIFPIAEIDLGGDIPNSLGWYTEPMVVELDCSDRTADMFYSWNGGEDWVEYDDPFEPPMGNHTLLYYAQDVHSNSGPISSILIPYDITVPKVVTAIEPSTPDGSVGWYTSQPVITLSTDGKEGEIIYYYIDKVPEQIYTSPVTIPEGEHTLFTYSIDRAGNQGSKVQFHFKVDTHKEVTTLSIDSSPNSEGIITDVPMIFLRSSEGTLISYSWDGNFFTTYGGALLPPGEEGDFTLFYYCMDEAGNKEDTRSEELIVDAVGPQVVLTGPLSADAENEVIFDLSKTTDGFSVEDYFIDFGDGTDSGWVSSPSISHKYGSGGTYEVKAKARDSSGNEGEEKTLTIKVNEKADNTILYVGLMGITLLIVIFIGILLAFALTKKKQHYMHTHPIQGPSMANGMGQGALREGRAQMVGGGNLHQRAPLPPIQKPAQNVQNNTSPQIPTVVGPSSPPTNRSPPPPPRMPEIPGPPKPPI